MKEQFKILVVDDEMINLRLVTSALKEEYTLFVAHDGHEAIDLLEKHKPDLLLLDVMMPELSGFEVCSIIKADERYADIPVIFLTALDSHDVMLQGLEIGAIDYLVKPFNIGMLKLRVRNHLALKAQRDLLKLQNKELEEALARVKQLEGIIPICMYCKRIRDDQSSWQQLEEYISEHSEAQFSHGICPHCIEEQMKKI